MSNIVSAYDTVRIGPMQNLSALHKSKQRRLVIMYKKDKKAPSKEFPAWGVFNSADEIHTYIERRMLDIDFRRRFAGGCFLPLEISGAYFVDAGWGT